MTRLLLTIWPQANYVYAIHRFIRDLLIIVVPELSRNSEYIRSDSEFRARIEDAIVQATSPDSTESNYIHAIVNAACEEMRAVCHLLRAACCFVGFDEVATEYLDAKRFKAMLLRKDEEKLERLNAIVRDRNAKPIKILMDVAAALNENAAGYDGLDSAAKRKARVDLGRVVESMANIVSGAETRLGRKIDSGRDCVIGHVDEVGAKIAGMKFKGKRRSRHTEEQRKVCFTCWNAAQRNVELRYSSNRSVTYEAAFDYYRKELARVGIAKLSKFIAVIHALQTQECADRKRALEAKREAERKAKSKTKLCSRLTTGH